MSHAMFSYPPSGPVDLNGTAWDVTSEGHTSFNDFTVASPVQPVDSEDFSCFSFVQPGPIPDLSAEDFQGQWAGIGGAVGSEQPLKRALSTTSRSSGSSNSNSNKYRVSKSASTKGRRVGPAFSPTTLAALDFASTMSPTFVGSYHTSPIMEQALFLDTDVVSAPFCPMMPGDGLGMPCDMTSMHIDPTQITQMRLDTEAAALGVVHSPCGTWDSFSSPVSRTSSPDGGWTTGNLTSPPQSNASPLLVAQTSPTCAALGPDDDLGASYHHLAMIGVEDAAMMQARRAALHDGESARDHPFYKMAAPGPDGLYHCPFESDPSCNHKPEKLKCNYDKFVDSHLKPYRCKNSGCGEARFSSTACLLRHEREAHAMHGHGDKPFLCTHDGCDRSLPGNGFPRQWNLRDHMKRVHHTSPPPMTAPGHALQAVKARKRRSDSGDAAALTRKASTKSAAAADAAAKAAKALNDEWRERHTTLVDLVPRLSSSDDEHVMEHILEARRQLDSLERLHGNRVAPSA